MTRVRAIFALLFVVLVVAAGALVHRALAGVEAEETAQRETLAARVFDEMERALSEWLSGEEAVAAGVWLSPVSAGAGFVVARFEIGAGNALRFSASPPQRLRALVEGWAERRAAGRVPAPGGSRELGAVAPEPRFDTRKDSEDSVASVYDALQSLNLGAKARAQRSQKQGSTLASPAPTAAAERKESPSAPAAVSDEVAPPQGASDRDAPVVTVDPLLGDRLEDGSLLLVRTVLEGDRGHRQALVIDGAALGDWLRDRAVRTGPLAGAVLSFWTEDLPAAGGDGVVHRFADPFDALQAELVLPSLHATGSAATVLRLSLLLALVAGAGLLALYRMVAVALRFAEQRSRFVASVSHELKTPLTAIRMYAEMLRDGLVPGEEKRAEYTRTIAAESERLSRLIDNVLEFARIDRGERPLTLRTGPLEVEVAAVCESLRPHAAQEGFALVFEAASGLPAVAFDRDAVAQIVVNLVDNALKYARDSARREVRVSCAERDGGVSLTVRDFGPGVASRDLSRIFELFERVECERTRATRGTGLGLALVRSLAGRMRARASARNAPDAGLEVSVVFPGSRGA